MNDTATSATGASLVPSTTDAFTAAHLAIIAILIVLVLVAILYGMKLARRRHVAERRIDAHNATVEAGPVAGAVPAPPPPLASSMTDGDAAVDAPVPEPSAGEPIAAAAPRDTGPASAAMTGSGGAGDGPVTQLKGLGPKVAARLAELGVTTTGQLAALDDAGAARLDGELGAFKGRLTRDRWIEQARLLAAGDKAGFEAAFGKL